MNKKIKSINEIHTDLSTIIGDIKNEEKLREDLNKYLDTLTGKEIISREEIKSYIGLSVKIISTGSNIKISKKFFEEFHPDDKFDKLMNAAFTYRDKLRNIQDPGPSYYGNITDLVQMIEKVPINIIKTCDRYKNLKELNVKTDEEIIEFVRNYDSAFDLLYKTFDADSHTKEIINQFMQNSKRDMIIYMIVNDIIPLQTILLYFNRFKNVTENVNELYILLEKRIPRDAIQQTIMRNLDKIKEGKFSVPNT